ncbi:MAG TPA: Na+/H+ antiporter subunit E [Candidatus Methanofastidiosa archaeon]|nr:Na+/H+ antiporter subunit E [Candidatus Methanofastidiosa archaeon]HPR41540.1 Na+/H+ antiporter subunit E [Candidatus Methanofastidiosa archaeon]
MGRIISRPFYAVAYIFVLLYYIAMSAINVVYLTLRGTIKPEVKVIDTVLTKEISQAFLANSITLTPGTLTIDVDHKAQKLTVSVLTPRDQSAIIPFEKYIKGVFE